jgi:acetoacetyl-CoA synthetase
MQIPTWSPSPERVERANLSRFMRFARTETGNADLNSYAPLWHFSVDHPERFWTLLWDFCGIRASGAREPVLSLSGSPPVVRWFPDVRINVAQNLLRFDDDRAALVHRAADGALQRLTHAGLRAEVAALAAALKSRGIRSGDAVAGLLDNRPEAIIAALACASIGAMFSVLPADISPHEAITRLSPLAPRMVFVQHAGDARRLQQSLPGAPAVVTLDHDGRTPADETLEAWPALLAPHAGATLDFTATAFDHPFYVLHGRTSDTALVQGAGGTLIQHLKELVLHADLKREDRVLFAGQCGSPAWTRAVSCLAVGAAVVLHASDPADDPAALWQAVEECNVSVLAVDPQAITATLRAGLVPRERHKLPALKTLLCDGLLSPSMLDFLHCAVDERLYVMSAVAADAMIGATAIGAPPLPVSAPALHCRALAMAVDVIDDDGQALRNAEGRLVVRSPFPSMPIALVGDPDGSALLARYAVDDDGGTAWSDGTRATLTDAERLVLASDEQPLQFGATLPDLRAANG